MKLQAKEQPFASRKKPAKKGAPGSASYIIHRERTARKVKRNERRHGRMLRLAREQGIDLKLSRPEIPTPVGANWFIRIKWASIRMWRKLFLVG